MRLGISTHKASEDLLDDVAVAEVLDLRPGTLAVWRSTGRYNLPYLKVGRKVRYRRSDLIDWMASRRTSGDQVAAKHHSSKK